MPTPILATKLFFPPPRPKLVPRPRLMARLHEGLHGKLTLISAPAGFGKTTLVSEWLAAVGGGRVRPTAWLALDEGDGDPHRFLTYVVAALRTLDPTFGDALWAALDAAPPTSSMTLLTRLLNEIAAMPTPLILVLDDYHTLDAPAVDEMVAFLLEHLPPQMHVVITTREDPQLPLMRLRGRGQLSEARASDLRFTPDEAARFLHEVMGLTLTPEQVAVLETRTEGWIAGLQLAALSLRGRTDMAHIDHFVHAFAGDNRYILDYLIEEVLQRQPASVRNFLLQTAILTRLSGPLCNAVTGAVDGAAQLDALERGNLFVVPLDEQRRWFRYHHLFADVLTAHLRQEQPAMLPRLHQRASAWYASQGLRVEAIRHALAAPDFARAAELIELAWPEMDGHFQTATWLQWAKALPDATIRTRPVLSLDYGWAILNEGDLEGAERYLVEAERWLVMLPTEATNLPPDLPLDLPTGMEVADMAQWRYLPASVATARTYQAQARGDIAASIAYGQRALDLLPVEDYLRRGPAAALLGLAQWSMGDLDAAYATLAAAMHGFQAAGNLHFAISVTSGLVEIRRTQGRLRDAVKTNRDALHLALAQGEPPLHGTANLYAGLSELACDQGDLAMAAQHLAQSEALGEDAGLPDWRYRFFRAQAYLMASRGDVQGALDALDEAARHFYRSPVPDLQPLAAWQARLWLAQGRVLDAVRWGQEARVGVDDALSFDREYEHVTLARVLMAQHQAHPAASTVAAALRLLDRLLDAAAGGGRMGSVIEIACLQALAHQAQGDPVQARAALHRALRLAAPEGYVRVFVETGAAMMALLDDALADALTDAMADTTEPELAYLAHLRQRLAVLPLNEAPAISSPSLFSSLPSPLPTTNVVPKPRVEQLVEQLSAREIEVLTLMAEGLGNQAIADRLYLSPHTVKVHARNIFGKLAATSRTHAIARGRSLGLLPQG